MSNARGGGVLAVLMTKMNEMETRICKMKLMDEKLLIKEFVNIRELSSLGTIY